MIAIIETNPWAPISRGMSPFEVTLDSAVVPRATLPFYSERDGFSSETESSHTNSDYDSEDFPPSSYPLLPPPSDYSDQSSVSNCPRYIALINGFRLLLQSDRAAYPSTIIPCPHVAKLIRDIQDLVCVESNPGPQLSCLARAVLQLFALQSWLIRLVGIETNPGPKGKKGGDKGSKQVAGKQKKKQNNNTRSRGPANTSLAIPGRYTTPRSMSTPQQLLSYMRCLNDPFNVPPCRPGVMCAVPTGLFTGYLRITSCSTTNYSSWTIVPSRLQYPIMASASSSGPYTYANIYVSSFPQFSAVNALYEKVRLLAAGVRIIPMQASTVDGGQISSCLMPGERSASIAATGIINTSSATQGYVEIPSYPQALVSPWKLGTTIFWRPQDPNSFTFREAPLTDTNTSSATGGTQETLQDVPYFMIGMSGTNNNVAAAFTIELIAHFEGTVGYGNSGVIELVRASPVNDGDAMKAVDAVFTDDVRTAKPGFIAAFNEGLKAGVQARPKKSKSQGSLWKDLLSFGSSVVPLITAVL